MGFKSMAAQEKIVEAGKYENSKRETRLAVYRKYGVPHGKFGGVVPSEANDRMISEMVDRYLDYNPDVHHTLEIFEASIQVNPSSFNSLHKQSERDMRRELTDQIIGMLAAHGKAHDEFSLKSERVRLTTFTIPMLRARLADLQLKAKMAGQSVQSLKAMVVESRVDHSPYPGFPVLPQQLFENGVMVDVNRHYLTKTIDSFQLRKMCRIYGLPQVNARIARG